VDGPTTWASLLSTALLLTACCCLGFCCTITFCCTALPLLPANCLHLGSVLYVSTFHATGLCLPTFCCSACSAAAVSVCCAPAQFCTCACTCPARFLHYLAGLFSTPTCSFHLAGTAGATYHLCTRVYPFYLYSIPLATFTCTNARLLSAFGLVPVPAGDLLHLGFPAVHSCFYFPGLPLLHSACLHLLCLPLPAGTAAYLLLPCLPAACTCWEPSPPPACYGPGFPPALLHCYTCPPTYPPTYLHPTLPTGTSVLFLVLYCWRTCTPVPTPHRASHKFHISWRHLPATAPATEKATTPHTQPAYFYTHISYYLSVLPALLEFCAGMSPACHYCLSLGLLPTVLRFLPVHPPACAAATSAQPACHLCTWVLPGFCCTAACACTVFLHCTC